MQVEKREKKIKKRNDERYPIHYWKFINHVRAYNVPSSIFPVPYFSLYFLPLSINNALLRI